MLSYTLIKLNENKVVNFRTLSNICAGIRPIHFLFAEPSQTPSESLITATT